MTDLERAYKSLYAKRWREKNRERINAKARAYRAANRESVNAKARAYYAANRDRILARKKAAGMRRKEDDQID